MGIIKIRPRGPGNHSHGHAQRSFQAFPLYELAQEERLFMEKSADHDSDDCELAEVGCENVMVGDQTCNIPYELYDLADLKDVLSLETWNSCLTEEERFSLAAYLPDMDQQTYWLTIKELLSGDILFFGSPLEQFFCRLKGGVFSPQIARLREARQFLQRRRYYYSLRSYHENMAQKFVEMRRAWSNFQPSSSVEERVRIWNNKKDHKPVFLVDLNAFPTDEDLLHKGDKNMAVIPLLKKSKLMNEGINTHVPTLPLNGMVESKKTKAKGVLKIKPIDMNSVQNQLVQPLAKEPWDPPRRAPKGVLKIKPKTDPLGEQERLRTVQTLPPQIAADLSDVYASRFSPRQYASNWSEVSFGEKILHSLHQTGGAGKTYASSVLSDIRKDQQREGYIDSAAGSFRNHQSFQRKIKTVKDMRLQNAAEERKEDLPLKKYQNLRIYSQEAGGADERHRGENYWQSTQQSRAFRVSSADSYPFASENRRGESLLAPMCPTNPGPLLRMPTIGTDKHQNITNSSDHSDSRHRDLSDGRLNTPAVHMSVSGKEDLMFPITYMRRKAYRRLNPVDSIQHSSAGAKLEPLVPSGAVTEKAKTIKIKFKGWNDRNVQHRQGLLNGLQHDSPSS